MLASSGVSGRLRGMNRVVFVLLLSSLSTCVAHADGPPTPDTNKSEAAQERRTRFAGSWRWVGGEKEVAARDAAVEKGIESLFFAIRGIARSKIKSSVEIRQQIGFAFQNGSMTLSASGRSDVTSPEDGRVIAYKGEDGKTVKLAQAFVGERTLVQTFNADEGGRSTSFALSADGKTLRATYKIFSPKLSNPIVYTLTYQR